MCINPAVFTAIAAGLPDKRNPGSVGSVAGQPGAAKASRAKGPRVGTAHGLTGWKSVRAVAMPDAPGGSLTAYRRCTRPPTGHLHPRPCRHH